MRLLSNVICCLLTLQGGAPAPQLQPAEAKEAAKGVAAILLKESLRSAVVLDFSGPDKNKTELGRYLADTFRDSLAAVDFGIPVWNQSALEPVLRRYKLRPEFLNQLRVAQFVGQEASVDSLIIGFLSVKEQFVFVEIQVYGTNRKRMIGNATARLPLDDHMRSLLANPIPLRNGAEGPPKDPWLDAPAPDSVPRAGRNGVGYPRCEYCLNPTYTETARKAGIQCTVLLLAVVSTEGSAGQIQIARSCPFGLTEKSIEAVRRWRFRPAEDCNGKPITAWAPIEINFRIY
jgi:TonB family protein